ncbi:MAG: acetyl xylan esterase [Segetibacter sp.]|nr:acetyl xylan esterase [Segetibacter sp.]
MLVSEKYRTVGAFFKTFVLVGFLLFANSIKISAQGGETPPTESYTLRDPLVMNNGNKVTGSKQWYSKRRKELIELFSHEMYGTSPARPANMTFKVFDVNKQALNGRATRKQVTVYFNGKTGGPQMDVLIYLPNNVPSPVPVILQLNFDGNHRINSDTGIRLSTSWMEPKATGVVNNRATEASRGNASSGWDVDMILERGYGFATIYRGDIDPDYNDSFKNGVHSLYPELQGRGNNFSTVGAWAWGLSRAMDYLQTDKDIDAKKVALFGFSRLGKAALWAGATDERFAIVISNQSGAGGAKLFHRGKGENIRRLCTVFPHWFCSNFRKYIDKDTILPFDQHMVISLIAPRPVYIASAEEDKNSDPEGEFYSALAADPVYRFLGTEGLPAKKMPALSEPIPGRIAYHIRPGGHSIIQYDWEQYLHFIDKYFKKSKQ